MKICRFTTRVSRSALITLLLLATTIPATADGTGTPGAVITASRSIGKKSIVRSRTGSTDSSAMAKPYPT